jgi:peptidoglycan/LPS O-acetylase OafA/YrhL
VPSVLAYYALFFGFGATLCVYRDLVTAAGHNAWRWVACALATTLPAALLFARHISAGADSGAPGHALGLLVYAVATWSSLIALVGLADRYLSRPRPTLRYLADASYWIYLSHMPAAVLLVALLGATALGTAPQFALVTVGALAFSLLTYPLLVRYSVIGRVLNGRRQRGSRPPVRAPSALRGAVG